MSTEDSRERALAYGMRVGEALARQHSHDAENLLPIYAEQSTVTLATREAMKLGMWTAYLARLVTHISAVIGAHATSEMLREVSEVHGEKSRAN